LARHAGSLNATYPMIENATSAAANHAHTGAFDSMIGPPVPAIIQAQPQGKGKATAGAKTAPEGWYLLFRSGWICSWGSR
jgi:hypothetical protein